MAKTKTEIGKRKEVNETGVHVRTEKELADDLALICQYRKQNIGWRTIAQKINSQRDYDLNFSVYYFQYHTAKSNVQKEALANKDELVEAELSEIDWQISELQLAWERSKGLQTKSTTGERGSNVTEWEEHGDPRYMAEITKLRERRARILGLDAPEKHDFNINPLKVVDDL